MNGVWIDAQPNTAAESDGTTTDRNVTAREPATTKSVIAPASWVAPASLIACPAVLLAFLAVRYGLEPTAGLRAMLALVVLGAIPGYVIQRHVLRLRAAGPFEQLASSLLLGTLITPAVWYALCLLGLSIVFFPMMFGLAAVVPFASGWHRDLGRRALELVKPVEALLIVFAFGLAILWSWQLDLAAVEGDWVRILPHADHLMQTSLIAELARGVPAQTLPYIAGVDKWAYHYLPNVWCDLIRRVAGVDARTSYFLLAMPLRYVFVCLAIYLALVNRFGRPAALVGAICVLGFVGHPDNWFILANSVLTYLYWNMPASFGLVAVGLILYYAGRDTERDVRQRLVLMTFLSALLFWLKANFALALVPAVGVVAAWKLIPRRDWRCLAVCFFIPVLAVALRTWDSATVDLPSPMAFEPWRFVGYMWWKGTLWLKAMMTEHSTGWMAIALSGLNTVRLNVDALPSLLRWPAMLVLCVLYLFHVGLFVAVIARVRCGFGRLRRGAHLVDVLILLIVGICVVGFAVFPIQPDVVWNVSMHLFALVSALLICLMGPVLCDLARSARRRGLLAKTTFAVLLTACIGANGYALVHKAAVAPVADMQDTIPYNLYACYGYIDRHAEPNAMVLGPRFEQGLRTAGMLTQRRVVLEWGPGVQERRINLDPLLDDLRAFYGGTTPGRARAILQRYGVTHVIAPSDLVDRTGYGPLLHQVYRSGGLGVYRTTTPPPNDSDRHRSTPDKE